jgi:hypothetical protein
MAVPKVILVTLVLALLTLGTVDGNRQGVLLEEREVSFIKSTNIYQHIG